jgi:murein DD-endopeptidase MepM/ murein hydrolase activator NlpD
MKKVKVERGGIGEFLRSKGFYVALAACLVAVGAATWVALNSLKPVGTAEGYDSSASQYYTAAADSDAQTADSSAADGNMADVSSVYRRPQELSSQTVSEDTVSGGNDNGDMTAIGANTTAKYFVLPITGDIIKGFSADELQYSDTYKDWRLHTAIDIQGDLGANIKSCGEGRVIEVANDPKWGKTVKLDHGNGIVALYCGLDAVNVSDGDVVEVNQTIGTLGEIPCECIEAVHLHLSFTQNGTPVSPLSLMGLEPTESQE